MKERRNRMREHLRHLAAEFIHTKANKLSLITVTGADISSDFKNATIFVSVYPEKDEKEALHFLRRKRPDFRLFVSSHAQLKTTPTFDFVIDEGEKNRQHIDTLLEH